jgi:GntR family transcriptional regulator
VRRAKNGNYVEADGIKWTEAEETIAVRTDAPLALADLLRVPPGEPLHTYDALQTAEPGLRQLHRTYVSFSILLGTKYEEEAPPPAPQL